MISFARFANMARQILKKSNNNALVQQVCRKNALLRSLRSGVFLSRQFLLAPFCQKRRVFPVAGGADRAHIRRGAEIQEKAFPDFLIVFCFDNIDQFAPPDALFDTVMIRIHVFTRLFSVYDKIEEKTAPVVLFGAKTKTAPESICATSCFLKKREVFYFLWR